MKRAQLFSSILLTLTLVSASSLNAQQLGGSTGYGVDGATSNWVSVPIPAGTPISTIGSTTANGQGGDFISLFQAGFYTTQSGILVSIIAALGTAFTIAPITGLSPGQNIVGMGYDLSSATMYLVTSTTAQLYTLNISTGAATLIGDITNAPGLLAIAVNCAGEIYGIDATGDNLVNIDPTTGEGTIVGSLGVDAMNFAMDADFDPATGILYWTQFNGASGELRSVDTFIGNSTLLTTWSVDMIAFGIFEDCAPVGVEQTSGEIPLDYRLHQNYPNPFNPTTTIEYAITETSPVKLIVYDVLGNWVATLVNEDQTAGSYRANFNASNISSGIYVVRLTAGEFSSSVKITLMK